MIGSSGTVPGVIGNWCRCSIYANNDQSPRFRKTLQTVAITTCRFHILEYFYKHTPELCYTYHMSVFCIQTGVLTTDE